MLIFAQNDRGENIAFDDHAHSRVGTMSEIPAEGLIPSTTTDPDGRFTLVDIGNDRLIQMTLSAPGFASDTVNVVTRPIAPVAIPVTGMIEDNILPTKIRNGWDFTHVLTPAKPIAGTVREEGSGLPIAGINIGNTVTDAEGCYRIADLGRKPVYQLLVYPGDGLPYLPQKVKLVDSTDGFNPITADFTLKRGVKVEGRVVDRVTGRPAPGWLTYQPLRGNLNIRPYAMSQETYAKLDAEGRFSICALPGQGALLVDSSTDKPPAYRPAPTGQDQPRIDTAFRAVDLSELNAYRVIVAPDGADTLVCDLTVDSGLTVEGKIEDADGKPVDGVTVFGIGPLPFDEGRVVNGRFQALALDPGEPRRLFFYHPARKLAGQVVLRGREVAPVVVRLGPCPVVTGLLVDRRGIPVAEAQIGRVYEDGENQARVNFPSGSFEKPGRTSSRTGYKTDDGGRFRLDDMVFGVKFRLQVAFLDSQNFEVILPPERPLEPGQVLDLGDVRIDTQKLRAEPAR